MRIHLGLFDTPENQQQVRLAILIVGVLLLSVAVVYPVQNVRWTPVPAYVPMLNAVMFIGELITATLLYSQATVFRSRALSVLGTGYLISALLLIPHTLTFPGAFAPTGLLGAGLNTTAWIADTRRLTFPISIILYVWLRQAESAAELGTAKQDPRVLEGAVLAVALTMAATLLTTGGRNILPPMFSNGTDVIRGYFIWYELCIFLVCSVAAVLLLRDRRSVLDLWLLVGLSGWLIHLVLNITSVGRFTVGFYWSFMLMAFSHLVVMLALIAESNRLYARLALSTSAWNREREARLTSIEALAAAVSHEVGQPLSGAMMSAEAGQRWLRKDPPDVERALKSLGETVDAGRQTFAVIKSIRATLASRQGVTSEFSLNDLVRATVSSLDRELEGENVSVQLVLDETLPTIHADRTQIERVLANLVTNAIESLSVTQGGPRCIVIRSAATSDKCVLLEVADNGTGIDPEAMERIFEIFFTTKRTGTGLGLSLCRTIVEAHGGRLWASQGEAYGASFHLQLPSGTPAR